VEMLYKSNVMALLGGGKSPKYNPNKIVLWDDSQTKVITEIRLNNDVVNINLKKEKVFVVCENKIHVLKFVSLQNLFTLETCSNGKGIIAVSADAKIDIIAYPDREKGSVKIVNTDSNSQVTIKAHNSNIAFLSLNSDGTLLATASEKGTLIRIFRTASAGDFLQEVRRGKEVAEIHSICFSQSDLYLACSSDRGTIHIFSLDKVHEKLNKDKKEDGNKEDISVKNTTSFFSSILPMNYFKSEWSFAQFRLTDKKPVCIFNASNNLMILTYDCKLIEVSFDKKNGGECKIERENVFKVTTSTSP